VDEFNATWADRLGYQVDLVGWEETVYDDADSTTFGDKEKFGLLESGFEHLQHENIPLWHWYREVGGFKGNNLWLFTIFGPAVIRAGALSAMTLIGQPIIEKRSLDRATYLKSWFSEQAETNIKLAALNYLGAWGITADVPYVRAELDRGDYLTRGAAADAYFSIILRDSHERALETLKCRLIRSPTMYSTRSFRIHQA
jgi:hypothetical protein